MRMTHRPGVATHGAGIRAACPTCKGAMAQHASRTKGVDDRTLCPTCQKRPELAELVSRMPTATFLAHAKTCKQCQFPKQMCATGLARLADVPGFWSTPAPTTKA